MNALGVTPAGLVSLACFNFGSMWYHGSGVVPWALGRTPRDGTRPKTVLPTLMFPVQPADPAGDASGVLPEPNWCHEHRGVDQAKAPTGVLLERALATPTLSYDASHLGDGGGSSANYPGRHCPRR